MTTIQVTNQAELDAALVLDQRYLDIEIRSPRGVWLELRSRPKHGSSTVRAYDSSTVTAYDSSTVTATGSSTVRAYDSSTVRAYDSSTVTATGSSTVTATGSSTVTATGSSTVRAYDSSTVTATGSSTVTATKNVAVHLHSARVRVDGGVVIDVSTPVTDARAWCEDQGVEIVTESIDGEDTELALVFKAVDDRWTTGYGFDYSPGATPAAPDWRADNQCGGGLHFGPTPVHSLAYHSEATRFVVVGVALEDLNPIPGQRPGDTAKCKAPRVVRACLEVDIDGTLVPVEAAVAGASA